jgi:hypothetical protein
MRLRPWSKEEIMLDDVVTLIKGGSEKSFTKMLDEG